MSVPATQENKFIKYPEKIIQRLMSYRRQTWFSLPVRAIFFMGNLRVLRYDGMPKSLEADWMIQLYKLAARTPFRCLESWWLSRKHHRCLFVPWIQKKRTKDNSSVSLRAEGHSFFWEVEQFLKETEHSDVLNLVHICWHLANKNESSSSWVCQTKQLYTPEI